MAKANRKVSVSLGNIIYTDGVRSGSYATSNPFTNTATFVDDPDFRVKIAKNQDASHTYSMRAGSASVRTLRSASRRKSDGLFSEAYTRHLPNTWLSTSISDADLQDLALSRLKRRLASDVKGFRTLIPLGEIKETRRLVRDVSKSTNGVLTALLSIAGLRKSYPYKAKKAAEAWLTWSFGIKPLLLDVNEAASAVSSYLLRQDYGQIRYVGIASKEWFSTGTVTTTAACGSHSWSSRTLYKHNLLYKYTAGIHLDLSNDVDYGIGRHFGITFGDIIPAAWELIPYSWIVDYFTTTGAFFEDVFTASPGNTVYCTLSKKYQRQGRTNSRLVNNSPAAYLTCYSMPEESRTTEVFFDRTVLASLPHRAFRFKTLDEIGIGSVKKLLNLASLLVK